MSVVPPDARRRRLVAAGLATAVASPGRAQPAAFPAGPVVIVVPSTPGSITDRAARTLAARLSSIWPYPVSIEYRAGAAGVTGAAHVAQSPPDGHTLLFASVGTLAIAPALNASMPYDAGTAFSPISLIADMPMAWVAGPSVPAGASTRMHTFVDFVRARPGRLTYASQGIGSASHLFTELLLARIGISMHHAPFRGGTPVLAELVGGHIDAALITTTQLTDVLASGRLKVLAVSSRERLPGLPDVPTLSESVARGFRASVWVGLLAPARTPPSIVEQIATDLRPRPGAASASVPEPFANSAELGLVAHRSSPAEFASFLAAEQARFAAIVRRARIAAG